MAANSNVDSRTMGIKHLGTEIPYGILNALTAIHKV